jgi:hypothetical protein
MTKISRASVCALFAVATTFTLLGIARTTSAFSFTTFDAPNANGETVITGINGSNTIVGWFLDSSLVFHGFLENEGGAFIRIDHPDASSTTKALGISNSGQIVGIFESENGSSSFLRTKKGTFIILTAPNATIQAFGINNGRIVGVFEDSHGFVKRKATFTKIDVRGAQATHASGINGKSEIVGYFQDANGTHGFLREKDGTFTTIDDPDSSPEATTQAWGINDTGDIVGIFNNTHGTHGFLRANGNFTTIDFPGASATYAFGINDTDTIVGKFQDTAGFHGFVANPK